MAAAGVDLGYLATHLGMPETNLSTATTDPTTDLVNAILSAVAAKAHDFDTLFSQKLQLEVELETSVRGAEAQRDASNETAKKALKEVEDMRQKLTQQESARQTLENELQVLKSSTSASQSDLDTLRARITSLETSNRESMAIIDTKNATNDTLAQELQAQHQKNMKLSQEVTSLQQAVQIANAAAGSAKIREQGLQRQLESAKRDAEWAQNELKTKSAEALKYRKEKGARIAELQRQNDDAAINIESLKRTEQQLRRRLEEAQTKADQSLSKIQQLEEGAARREEDFQQQIDRMQRLQELTEQQKSSQMNRVHDLEQQQTQIKRDCEDKIQRISKELASVNIDMEKLTQTNESLRADVGRLEAQLAGERRPESPVPGSAPQTPRPLNGSVYRAGSPFATPGSSRKFVTATQALDQYYKVKGELDVYKERAKVLGQQFDEVNEMLEAVAPEVEELKAANKQLVDEAKAMSVLSDQSFRSCEAAKQEARKAEAEANQRQIEINTLRNQLRELGAQVQMLLFNAHVQDKGWDELSLEETLHYQKLERGQVDGNAEDINSMILQRLVVFKDIQELQEKNEKLLQVTHELGQKMESEEAITAKNQAVEDHNERLRLQQELDVFRDTLRSFQVKTESITKERDLFRRIVESRASADEVASALGRAPPDGVLSSIENNSTMNDESNIEYAALLDETRKSFDEYRKEQSADRKTLKEQIEQLSAERNKLQNEVSRITSQLSLASERHEMLKSNFAALDGENKELQKRNQVMSESAAKQDIRTQNVAEELVEARSMVESMRSENANLRAEKNLWTDIQNRLNQDNENLVQEKARLNALITTHQNLQNERELADNDIKRRLNETIQSLEANLTSTKRKLDDEIEEAKKAQLRKEFDARKSQERIDELSASLGQIREELVAVKTSRDHLQSRVDELTIQLRSAEERAERLQPRPTPRPGSMAEQNSLQEANDERIQELIHEATDLKRDLQIAQAQLENAQAQVEQYKELSQASEEELERLSAAQEQYTQEMDNSLTTKDATIKELEQRVEDLSSELNRSNTELSTLRDSQANIARRFEEEKGILAEEVKRLKDEEERYNASTQFHQQDLRAQAEIASNAQQAYETEVMNHGETLKTLATVRTEFNQLKTTVATYKAEADSAKATLLQSEGSWEDRRQRLEQEISEIRARWDDSNAHNKTLHQQLETVTTQISALQESRNSAQEESLETIATQPSNSDADRYREISNYLRRDKDILEVQYELKVQDVKRLQQQLEYTRSQLDEARLKLDQERRSHGDSDRNTMAHKDLMSKLEELNLFRESSATLRAEVRQAQAQLAEKTTKINELESSIQPLEAQIEELQSQLSFKEADMKQLQEDRNRWQKRTEDILSKHGQTDPAELEELKQKVETLEHEKTALLEAETPLREKIQELEQLLETKTADWAVMREKLVQSAKDRSKKLTEEKRVALLEKDQEKAELQKAFDEAVTGFANTEQELAAFRNANSDLEKQVAEFQGQIALLQTAAQTSATPATSTDSADSQAAIADLQAQLTAVQSELETVSTQKASVEHELQSTQERLNVAVAERDEAVSKAQGQPVKDVPIQNGVEHAEDGQQNEPTQTETPSQPLSDSERQALEERISAAEARATQLEASAAEWEAKATELQKNHDNIIKNRSDKMKETLNKRLSDNRAAIEAERAQMKQDREKLEADFKLKIEQERKIWEAENPRPQAEPKVPSTPQQPKAEATAQTPNVSTLDLSNLGDKEIRELVSTNVTIKGIVQNNIKNKLAIETKKVKEELEASSKAEAEQKITQAREQASQLATSKMNLKLSMAENRSKAAIVKLEVVETAAKETPERPVGEVWEVAKVAKPPPPPPKPATPAAPAAAPTANAANAAADTTTSTPQEAASIPPAGTIPKPAAVNTATAAPANPFASSTSAPNPFATSQPGQPAAQQSAPSGLPQPVHAAPSQLPKASGLPLPGGARNASGPGPQAGRGGARGGGAHRGRGGAQQGRPSLNAGAPNFQPGNKRPRGDSEIGSGGAKRARGGGAGS